MQAPRWEPQVLLTHTMPPVLHMLFVVLAVQAAIAGFDLFWVRLRYAQQLRMSKEDVREEQRETGGRPEDQGADQADPHSSARASACSRRCRRRRW